MPRQKKTIELAGGSVGQIIQFRADDMFVKQLSIVSERLRTPMGVLARQWVAERLAKEIKLDRESMDEWLEERNSFILKKQLRTMEAGPVQVMHIVPFSHSVEIDPEKAKGFATSFAPAERIDLRFAARVNLHGLITEKTFASSEKLNSYVQVFRTGQVESVRILNHDDIQRVLFGDEVEIDLLRSIWIYLTALRQLNVPLPLLITVDFHGFSNFSLRTKHRKENSVAMEFNDFSLPQTTVTDWNQVREFNQVAEFMHSRLNILWNAAGFIRSPNLSRGGTWQGDNDSGRTQIV